MFREPTLLVILLGIGLLSTSCRSREHVTRSVLMDGAVVVELKRTEESGSNDCLTFQFHEKGTYEISFLIVPGGGAHRWDYLPERFTKTIEVVPTEVVLEQYILPDFLRVRVKREGKTKFCDFY